MCFSQNMSLAIGITGLLTSLYFYNKNIYASIGIGYLALMEIIQFFQYGVIDQCSNSYNKFLTILGYIHICFQPLFFNIWLFAFTKNPNFVFLYLSFFAGLLLLSRLFFVEDNELCDTKSEPICGDRTCSFSGQRHIAWNVRLRASGWITPTIGLHFFMWVVPVLTTLQFKPIMAMLLTGPYLGFLLSTNIHERPAIWCYTGISQMLVTHFLLR
jgi:hypothetical protein